MSPQFISPRRRVTPRMKEAARELRKNLTPSETRLWQALRGAKLDNHKFRRQQAIGTFIADFYCSDERLIVEVDGAVHEHQREKDRQRQESLEAEGYRFVRVTADQVMNDLPGALAKIRGAFELQFSPPPSLPPGGGGAGGGGLSTLAPAPADFAEIRQQGSSR